MEAKIKIRPNKKQREAWKLLKDKTTEFILYGGAAGGGKTWLGAEWLLVMGLTYPGTRYFIGRNELKDVRGSVLETFNQVIRHHKLKPSDIYKFNGQDNFLLFKNGSRIDLLSVEREPSDESFDSLGSFNYTSGWLEECSEIDFEAFDTLKGRVGRHLNDKFGITGKILLTSNPKKNFLYFEFYKPWKDGTLPKNMAFIPAFVDDNEFIESQYKEKLENTRNPIRRQRLLEGDWEYNSEAGTLITSDAIKDLFSTFLRDTVPHGENYISADVARFGDDKTIPLYWSGLRVERIYKGEKQSVTESARQIRSLQEAFNVFSSKTVVDSDGVGAGVSDILQCEQFVNGSSPIAVEQETESYLQDDKSKGENEVENFRNLRAQCYFKLAEVINGRKMYINVDGDEELKKTITEELQAIRIKDVDTEGKLEIISRKEFKSRLGRSPDYISSLMMRMLFELKPQIQGPIWGGIINFNNQGKVEREKMRSMSDNVMTIGGYGTGRRN